MNEADGKGNVLRLWKNNRTALLILMVLLFLAGSLMAEVVHGDMENKDGSIKLKKILGSDQMGASIEKVGEGLYRSGSVYYGAKLKQQFGDWVVLCPNGKGLLRVIDGEKGVITDYELEVQNGVTMISKHPEEELVVGESMEMILVNKQNRIPKGYSFKKISLSGKEIPMMKASKVAKIVYEPLKEMMAACHGAGNRRAKILSGYRTTSYQAGLLKREISRQKNNGARNPATAAMMRVLPAYYSEHNIGLSVDIVNTTMKAFGGTKEALWLKKNSWRYGFILRYRPEKSDSTGIISEPWHYRYVGKDVAEYVTKKNLSYDEFVEGLGEPKLINGQLYLLAEGPIKSFSTITELKRYYIKENTYLFKIPLS